jgi:D-glycero-alpha-D-manno-heptose 1-phosphate guanylyltransferase
MSAPCIILAGGVGTRLRGVIPNLPKCLAPIDGRPFMEWQLRSLSRRGVEHFILALGHGSNQVLDELAKPWAKDFSIEVVIESEPLGTGGAVHYSMDCASLDEALVVNGDTFVGGSLHEMLAPLDSVGGECMRIATVHVSDRARFGGVAVDDRQCVTAFFEKGKIGSGVINAGFYRIHRCAFMRRDCAAFSMETHLMPRLILKGGLQARELKGPFIDIGVPDDYHLLNGSVNHYIGKD